MPSSRAPSSARDHLPDASIRQHCADGSSFDSSVAWAGPFPGLPPRHGSTSSPARPRAGAWWDFTARCYRRVLPCDPWSSPLSASRVGSGRCFWCPVRRRARSSRRHSSPLTPPRNRRTTSRAKIIAAMPAVYAAAFLAGLVDTAFFTFLPDLGLAHEPRSGVCTGASQRVCCGQHCTPASRRVARGPDRHASRHGALRLDLRD